MTTTNEKNIKTNAKIKLFISAKSSVRSFSFPTPINRENAFFRIFI